MAAIQIWAMHQNYDVSWWIISVGHGIGYVLAVNGRQLCSSRVFRADGRLVNISEFLRAQTVLKLTPSFQTWKTSRRTKLMVWKRFLATVPFFSQMVYHLTEEGHCCQKTFSYHQLRASACLTRWKRGRSLCIVCARKNSDTIMFWKIFGWKSD